MLAVIQLVGQANVKVDGNVIGAIDKGIVALIGIEKTDTLQSGQKLLERILNYRIFPDEQGRMNLSLSSVHGGLLLVPQFTLVAETHKGNRPGFSIGMPPEEGKKLFAELINVAKTLYPTVEVGEFGAQMSVSLINEGPVTFILQSKV